MNIEQFRNYCMIKPGTTEEFPFDEQALVFKVMGKMYALTRVDFFESINLKCDPEMAEKLRDEFEGVKPGYHMSKKHWNTVMTDGLVSDDQLYDWIDHSYSLVVRGLTKAKKVELKKLKSQS